MYTYFIVATESEVARMRSLDEVLDHIEKIEPKLGGNVDIGAISSLSKIFLQLNRELPKQTEYGLADGSPFYLLDAELCKKIAAAQHEQTLNASVVWDEESWQETGVNRMDLAGFLLDLAALCIEAQAKNVGVYALLSKQ
jgi:hypothetical protein